MKWKEKWAWWHWAIYGAAVMLIAAAAGRAARLFDDGYVPFDRLSDYYFLLETAAPVIMKGRNHFHSDCPREKLGRCWAVARFSK